MIKPKEKPLCKPISQQQWNKFKKRFCKENFYRKHIPLARIQFKNNTTKERIKLMQEKLWNDVLISIEELFEVNSYKDVYYNDYDLVEQWIFTYYEPNELLTRELEELAINIHNERFYNHKQKVLENEQPKELFIKNVKLRKSSCIN